jgi:PAB1-binding protein PBP1
VASHSCPVVNILPHDRRPRQQEDLYTTKLDKAKSRISEAEAERLAKEIMREAQSGGGAAAAHNAHLAEERGMEVDDSGVSHRPLLFAMTTSCRSHAMDNRGNRGFAAWKIADGRSAAAA